MSDEPVLRRIIPAMIQPRGEFPAHSDRPHAPMTRKAARERARRRLEEWRRDHGQRN